MVLSSRLQKIRSGNFSLSDSPQALGARLETATTYCASWCRVSNQGIMSHINPLSRGGAPLTGEVNTSSVYSATANGSQCHPLPRLKRLDISWCGNYHVVGFVHLISFDSDQQISISS